MSIDTECQMTQMSNDTKCQMTQNVKWHKQSNYTISITQNDAWCMMMDLWLQAETTGVTHFGAYNRPQDGHFYLMAIILQLLETYGNFWKKLALFGKCCQHVAGKCWQPMAIFGNLWQILAFLDIFWQMSTYGNFWQM